MLNGYVALFHFPEDGSAWGVTFPDLPGCTSAGESYADATINAEEALAGHIAALRAEGDPIPRPSTLEDLHQTEEFSEHRLQQDAFPGLVRLLDVPAPKERINIMIDRGVLRRVDEAARAEGISRSGYLERAAAAGLVESDHPVRKFAGGAIAAADVVAARFAVCDHMESVSTEKDGCLVLGSLDSDGLGVRFKNVRVVWPDDRAQASIRFEGQGNHPITSSTRSGR